MQVDGELPLFGRTECDGPGEVGRQGEFGVERAFVQARDKSRGAHDLLDLGRVVVHLRRAFLDFHIQARTVVETECPLFVHVPHDTDVDAYGNLCVTGQFGRKKCIVACVRKQRGVLSHTVGRENPGDGIVRRGAYGEHGARKIEVAPGDGQTRTYREFVADFIRHGGLNLECREVDVLNEVRTGPVRRPFHGRAERCGEVDADAQPLGGFVVEIDVHRGRNLVVGLRFYAVFARIVDVAVSYVGGNSRDAGRNIEFGGLESGCRRVEMQRLRVEFERGAHVAHTVLFRGEIVYLITLGVSAGGDGSGGQNEEKFFHNELVWFILGMPRRHAKSGAKVGKLSPRPKLFGLKFPKNVLNGIALAELPGSGRGPRQNGNGIPL